MNERIPENDSTALTSWKDIARYMGKGVRTVQRWEQEFGLPVRRPTGTDHKSAVLAYRQDIDAWLKSSWSLRRRSNAASGTFARRTPDEIRDTIQTSRELRAAHYALLHEIKTALNSLVQNCGRLSKEGSAMD
jgi:hypothetical protein